MELPRPKLGNRETIEYNIIRYKSAAQENIIFKPSTRPVFRKLHFTYGPLNWTKYREFIEFLRTNMGKLVILTDHEDNVYTGFFSGETIDIEQEFETTGSPITGCSGGFSVSLEFTILTEGT